MKKGDYFSENVVLDALGGGQLYKKDRRDFYRLNSGDLVVIRNNKKDGKHSHYWCNLQCDLVHSDIRYVVCVASYEGIYSIPISIISDCAEKGCLSITADELNYKLVLQRYSGRMCLHLKGSDEHIDIEQFQIYHNEKTYDNRPEQALSLSEGAKKEIDFNVYERNPDARKRCIEHYGAKCQVCGFDFAETYGSDYEGVIEVHHIIPISSIQAEYTVDPIKDLIPLCPNCHTAIHKMIDNRCLTVEELRRRVASHRK